MITLHWSQVSDHRLEAEHAKCAEFIDSKQTGVTR